MNNVTKNPISVATLVENIWVFTIYGFFVSIAIAIAVKSSFKSDLGDLEKVMMEPFSVYTFVILSIFGLFALGITNHTVAKSADQMKANWWVIKILLPIANSGLSAGAIASGMLLGIAIGMFIYSYWEPEAFLIVRIALPLALYILALLYAIVWAKRSMFDETQNDKKISFYAGIVYCVLLGIALWLVDPKGFFMVACVAVIGSGLIYYYVKD